MKAIKYEVYCRPTHIAAAQRLLLTDETQFSMVLPSGLLFVTVEKGTEVHQRLESFAAYVRQYDEAGITFLHSPVTLQTL